MSEETTQDMSNGRSFEARVFARFDSMDTRFDLMDTRFDLMDTRFDLMNARFDSLDLRVGTLETQSERRALETKPIWERALAEIGEVKGELGEVKSGLAEVKTGLTEVKERVGALEDVTKLMARKLDILNRDLTTLRAEQLGLEDRVEKLEPRNLP